MSWKTALESSENLAVVHRPAMDEWASTLEQRSPTPGPWTGAGPWAILYRAAEKE